MGDVSAKDTLERASINTFFKHLAVYTGVYMTRTNIDIDDRLVELAMERYGLRTKKEAVNLALEKLIGGVMTREQALAMRGFGWSGDLAEIRGTGGIELIWDD